MKNLMPFGLQIELDLQAIGDQIMMELKKLIKQHKLIVIKGNALPKPAFIEFSKLWGEVVLWPFGEILELKYDPTAQDHIFDNTRMPMHWDGMYREKIPHLQIFHCIESEQQQGRTIFTNTKKILEELPFKTIESWKHISAEYYRKAINYEGQIQQNLIEKHPLYDYEVLRYQENITDKNFKNPAEAIFQNAYEGFHAEILAKLYHPDYCYRHTWKSGDVVIADNFTLLHAREGYQSTEKRHIQRIQVHSKVPFKNQAMKESYEAY